MSLKDASESEKCSLPPDPPDEARNGSALGSRELARSTLVACAAAASGGKLSGLTSRPQPHPPTTYGSKNQAPWGWSAPPGTAAASCRDVVGAARDGGGELPAEPNFLQHKLNKQLVQPIDS
jgi:hypothetical protein